MNTSLLDYVEAEVRRLRALPGPCARFVADQLERTHQLLKFTGAETAEDFATRVECNEQWIKEEEFERGYQEGRAAMAAFSPQSNN